MSCIRVRNLRKCFSRNVRKPGLASALRALVAPQVAEVEAVRGVSFDVRRGESVAFIGPNGAGKSTTIKMLTGILHPTSGEAEVLGFVPWRDRKRLVARLGCVFGQRSQLWYHLPVAETFTLLASVYDVAPARARERLAELTALFELGELLDQPVRKLSLGQRMRCELAAALLHRPDAIFLDEPTIGLDVVARERIRELLVRLNEHEGVTVFLTSHDTGDIEHVCDRVLLINDGRVLVDTSLERLKREHLREKLVEAVLEHPAGDVVFDFAGAVSLPSEPHDSHRLRLRVDSSLTPIDVVVSEIVRRTRVRDLTVSDPSLDRVIATLYAETSQ
jgi:ABC-2 type transport system ATP-binding protein